MFANFSINFLIRVCRFLPLISQDLTLWWLTSDTFRMNYPRRLPHLSKCDRIQSSQTTPLIPGLNCKVLHG